MGSGGAAATESSKGEESAQQEAMKLVGFKNFVRHNPRSDKFGVHRFHHVEFWAGDATNAYKRFQHGLGMTLVAKSDHSTGNPLFASYVLQSHELVFAFTAPYSRAAASAAPPAAAAAAPLPGYSQDAAYEFLARHGMAVRAVGLVVDDARAAYAAAVANGGKGVLAPARLEDEQAGEAWISEVSLYGDVVLRFVSGGAQTPYLPGFARTPEQPQLCYGLRRLDHAVGNVPRLLEAVKHICAFTGFHEYAEFVADDVGTVDSGLNSMVLANNNEMVLLPINEPTFGTRRKSQIQTYLEQNEGAGLQHLALKTHDIISTLRAMRAVSGAGGFEFMPRPSEGYYARLPEKVGDVLSAEQLAACEDLGVLVDRDEQGVLLQIFTKPLGDRPTVFIEIIQRLGCTRERPAGGGVGGGVEAAAAAAETPASGAPAAATAAAAAAGGDVIAVRAAVDGDVDAHAVVVEQAAGCGGFGKGNFGELFKSIEDYERTLAV